MQPDYTSIQNAFCKWDSTIRMNALPSKLTDKILDKILDVVFDHARARLEEAVGAFRAELRAYCEKKLRNVPTMMRVYVDAVIPPFGGQDMTIRFDTPLAIPPCLTDTRFPSSIKETVNLVSAGGWSFPSIGKIREIRKDILAVEGSWPAFRMVEDPARRLLASRMFADEYPKAARQLLDRIGSVLSGKTVQDDGMPKAPSGFENAVQPSLFLPQEPGPAPQAQERTQEGENT